MKSLLILIIATFTIGAAQIEPIHPVLTDEFKQQYRIDLDNLPYSNQRYIHNMEAAIEGGSLIYSDETLAPFGLTSCEASCHSKKNHLGPVGLQIGTGGTDLADGRKKLKYFPKDLEVDMPKINAPQGEDVIFRKKVLHDCSVTPQGQIGQNKGSFAHNIDWSRAINSPIYQHYMSLVFGDQRVTEKRFEILILAFQESHVSYHNNFQRYLRGEKFYKTKRDSVFFIEQLKITHDKCMNCHSGKDLGGSGLVMAKPTIKPGGDLSIFQNPVVAVKSLYNFGSFPILGWSIADGYKSEFYYLNRHSEVHDLGLSKKQIRDEVKFLRKNFND